MKLNFLILILLLSVTSLFAETDRPNLLWITSEDNGIKWVGCYGGVNTQTPNIDQLAKEGFRYTHCFDNAAVCAPTRSTWITGHYAISLGTQPMRSRYDIPHDKVAYYPDLLKAAGYHVSNGGKTDYNIGSRPDKECWLVDGQRPKLQDGQKFFRIKNIGDSHESNAFPRKNGGKVLNDPAKMVLHSYHPDLPEMRLTYATYADGVERMDRKVGEAIEELKQQGIYEDTIIVYCSDHGGVLPRSKRFLYSSGTHCPLIVRIPEKWKQFWPAQKPGMTVDRIVSFVDMPKTFLSLAGAEVPDNYQGRIFLGDGVETAPNYHLSFRERADECADNVRGMRDHRYAYIKNYMPWAANGQQLKYMWVMAGTKAWQQHYLDGKCDDITGRFFKPRPSEEFYDTDTDFDNINNLISDPAHQDKIAELKAAMRKKQLELYDSGLLPEGMRLRRAKSNDLTIYEMVRDTNLYPLAKYLDFADLALARDPANLPTFVETMNDADEGMRYWATCGLFLLEEQAQEAIGNLERATEDESPEVQMMAAYALHQWFGQDERAAEVLHTVKKKKDIDKPLLGSIEKWIDAKQPGDLDSFITDWQIIGPFKDGNRKKKDNFDPVSDTAQNWQPLTKGISTERIDLEQQFGEIDNCSAFVKTTLVSPIEQTATITAKCDDSLVARINGQIVEGKALPLKKGKNELVLKLIENGGGWHFFCRVTNKRRPVEGLEVKAR